MTPCKPSCNPCAGNRMHTPEEMAAFFAARVDTYDQHMLQNIQGLPEAYALLPTHLPEATHTLLDLGCGTGLELGPIYERFPGLRVTGIDLTPEMLAALRTKFAAHDPTLLCGSYFDIDFGVARFDAAISFETLHHFPHAQKLALYRRVLRALKPGGVYVETDYMLDTQAEEDALLAQRAQLAQRLPNPPAFLHFDTPLTLSNQRRLLAEAGFRHIAQVWRCGATVMLRAQA